MKKTLFGLILIMVLAALTACGKDSKSGEAEAGEKAPVTFTDALGREVTVEKAERVVTLLGSFCDEWLLAGGKVVAATGDAFSNYEFGFDDSVANIGNNMRPDVEQILAANPDLVLASSTLDSHVELLETLTNAGITVVYLAVNSFEDYLDTLKIFTQITGVTENYEKNGTEVAEEILKAKTQVNGSKPSVLVIRAAASNLKICKSRGTIGGEILADLDTANIADSDSALEDLSLEAIILADPDYIFIIPHGSDLDGALANLEAELTGNPAWNSLKAVTQGHYFVIEKALYNQKPNARWGEAYQKLADILYPVE